NGCKLHWERFRLDTGKKFYIFFTVRTIDHWNSLPRDRVESPSLEVFKMQLVRTLDNLV
ncbi:hypothetical protein N322_13186, partial [Cariama cristata]